MGAAPRPRGAGRDALLEAARLEFNEVGFEGTDTNRIARRAGYAPQTFYCHFAAKRAIFAALFEQFVESENAIVQAALPHGPAAIAADLLRHHTENRLFRRSLRALAITDPEIRATRVALRRRQIGAVCAAVPGFAEADAVALLLTADRLADAEAEGELAELGVTDPAGLLARTWQTLVGTAAAGMAAVQHLTAATDARRRN